MRIKGGQDQSLVTFEPIMINVSGAAHNPCQFRSVKMIGIPQT